jgi:hypothetical protein
LEAIIAACITAVASVIVALIQASSSQKQKRQIRKQSTRKGATIEESVPHQEAPARNRIWLWVGGIVVGSIFLYAIILPEQAEHITHWGAIPWGTCLLAYFRPIRWGYVAALVTLFHGIAILSEYMIGGWYEESDIPVFSLIFIGNAVFAAGIAFLRERSYTASQNMR